MKTKTSPVESLEWRYATKKFDNTKRISDSDFKEILKTLQLAPSSYGLQPFEFWVIEDEKLRAELKERAFNQPQVTDASHLILFLSRTDFAETDIDKFIELSQEVRDIPNEQAQQYAEMMKGAALSKSTRDIEEWTSLQTYLAIGQTLKVAAEMGIDASPMEGFDPHKFTEHLKLEEKGL
jgi:nitroreductase